MNDFSRQTKAMDNPIGIGLEVWLFSDSEILERIHLFWPPEGRYTARKVLLSFEAETRGWHLQCGSRTRILSDIGKETENVLLHDQQLLKISASGQCIWLYTEAVGLKSNLLHHYRPLDRQPIRIGSSPDMDIICRSVFFSPNHAELRFDGRSWTIRDAGAERNIFVNNHRVNESGLGVGDIIEIPGLRMIIGSGFLAIAEGAGRTAVSADRLHYIENQNEMTTTTPAGGRNAQTHFFSPFPRTRTAMPNEPIEIMPPPMSMNSNQMSFWSRMGSSMINGVRTAVMGNLLMTASTLLMPVLNSKLSKEEQEKHEKKRCESYRAYLEALREEIQSEIEREEQALRENYPPFSEVLTFTSDRKKLWSRRKTDDDFLNLRLGSGSYPMLAELDYPKKRFNMESDPLEEEMYALIEQRPLLKEVPVMLDIRKDRVLGVLGNREVKVNFIRSLMMRISLLFSCEEVKLVVLAENEDLSSMEFARWLPHIWNDLRTVRYMAAEAAEAYQIGEFISESIVLTANTESGKKDNKYPHYVVFAFSKRLLDGMESLKKAIQFEGNSNISILALFDDLPKECSSIIRLYGENDVSTLPDSGCISFLNEPGRSEMEFRIDSYKPAAFDLSSRALYRTELKLLSKTYTLPKTYSFLEMFEAGRIEHLNIPERWGKNRASRSLSVPVGIGEDGEKFMLDLHQKHHGPHGLVAGTTGSGKSEFLLTYILSLAVNYHPDEVAFLLIDYKGGGLAGAFDDPEKGIHLPHLIGTITNLDGSAIARSMICIQSEMIRRQKVFREARSKAGEGTMDIYTYQELYRKHTVDEPMPHLFIISDEFAELKQQQPDFLDSLVSIARVGRSLGVHLILATQKPGGIVTDQILSNTKFRVCLKVQDRTDSMDMLKRPEACELKDTGRFYLQVGNNELFMLGQAAWCGAEYEPAQTQTARKDNSIQAVDNTGASLLSITPEVKRSSTGQSQLVAIVQELSNLAERQHIQPGQLWKEPLKDRIDIETIPAAEPAGPGSVIYSCGMIDDPESLAQFPLSINLSGSNLLLVGEPGSGKTTFLQTMLCTLSAKYSPNELNYYVLDYSSHLLRLFSGLPHCGAVLTEEDEDRLDAFFDVIGHLLRERKELFGRLEVSSYESASEIVKIPLILVIIDNLVMLGASKKGQKHLDELVNTIKNCSPFGIRFVISITYMNEANTRVKQELLTRVALHMRDKYAYGEALNARLNYVPPEKSGRGMCMYDGRPLEIQMGMVGAELSERERIGKIKESIAAIKKHYAGYAEAAHIKTIPADETYEDFCKPFSPGRIPLGYDLNSGSPVALPLKQFSMLTLYFGNSDSIVPVLNNILYIRKRQDVVFVLMRTPSDSRFKHLRYTDGDGITVLDAEPIGVGNIVQTLVHVIAERRKVFLQYCERENLDPDKPSSLQTADDYLRSELKPLIVLFERLSDIIVANRDAKNLEDSFIFVFEQASHYQIYLIGCVYPDESSLLRGSSLYARFNPDCLVMLFGGNLKKQSILSVPYNMGSQDRKDDFNRCYMAYRGELHPMLMPCGIPEKEILPEDDRPIFAQQE